MQRVVAIRSGSVQFTDFTGHVLNWNTSQSQLQFTLAETNSLYSFCSQSCCSAQRQKWILPWQVLRWLKHLISTYLHNNFKISSNTTCRNFYDMRLHWWHMVAYWWYGLLLFTKINPKFCSSATDRNILYKLQVAFLLQANTSSRANSNNVTPPVQHETQTKSLLGDWSRKIILTGQSIRITQTHSTTPPAAVAFVLWSQHQPSILAQTAHRCSDVQSKMSQVYRVEINGMYVRMTQKKLLQ